MVHGRQKALMSACCTGLFVAACAGTPVTPGGIQTQAPLNRSAPGNAPSAENGPDGYTVARGTVSAVYSRLASGLNGCWLRDGQPLGRKYVLHAEVAPPPSQSATITVHLRTEVGRRGLKTYRIDMKSFGNQTRVISTNLKLPPRQATQIAADITRWSAGEKACASEAAWLPDVAGGQAVKTRKP